MFPDGRGGGHRTTADDYDAWLEQTWGIKTPEGRQAFVVDTDERARWALRKRRASKARIARRAQEVAEQIDRRKAWQAALDEADLQDIAWAEGLLCEYLEALRVRGVLRPKAKSYPLPEGRLQYRPSWRNGEIWGGSAFSTSS